MALRRWMQAPLALLLLLAMSGLAYAHGFVIYCGLTAPPQTLVAGQGGSLDVHIYDPFGNGLPEAEVKVTASQTGQPDQVWVMQEHPDGHYMLDIRFPAPGAWQLKVQMVSLNESFHGTGTVTAVAAGAISAGLDNAAVLLVQDPTPGSLPTWVEVALGIALLVLPLGLALFWRRKPKDGDGTGSGPAATPAAGGQ